MLGLDLACTDFDRTRTEIANLVAQMHTNELLRQEELESVARANKTRRNRAKKAAKKSRRSNEQLSANSTESSLSGKYLEFDDGCDSNDNGGKPGAETKPEYSPEEPGAETKPEYSPKEEPGAETKPEYSPEEAGVEPSPPSPQEVHEENCWKIFMACVNDSEHSESNTPVASNTHSYSFTKKESTGILRIDVTSPPAARSSSSPDGLGERLQWKCESECSPAAGSPDSIITTGSSVVLSSVDSWEDKDGPQCILCMGAPPKWVALPCKHALYCDGCFTKLLPVDSSDGTHNINNGECSYCRGGCKHYIPVDVAESAGIGYYMI